MHHYAWSSSFNSIFHELSEVPPTSSGQGTGHGGLGDLGAGGGGKEVALGLGDPAQNSVLLEERVH